MRFIYDHDYHIHSYISDCSSDPRQTNEALLAYAEANNLHTIVLTDHYWDAAVPGASDWYKIQGYDRIVKAKPLPQSKNVKFLFGCETDMDKFMTVGVAPEQYDLFDFIVIPTTHLHMMGFTLGKEDDALENRARLWVERLDALLNMDLPFHKVGIAHLTCSLMAPSPRENLLKMTEMIPVEEMRRLFTKAAEVGVGIELNVGDMNVSDEEADLMLRPYRIAKECGCKFYCASDAHSPEGFHEMRAVMERAIDLLGLEESDKFHIGE